MDLELHIEQLVLQGFGPEEVRGLREVLQQELQRLFAARAPMDTFAASFEVPRIDAGSFDVESGAGAQQIGTALAQAIYSGMAQR